MFPFETSIFYCYCIFVQGLSPVCMYDVDINAASCCYNTSSTLLAVTQQPLFGRSRHEYFAAFATSFKLQPEQALSGCCNLWQSRREARLCLCLRPSATSESWQRSKNQQSTLSPQTQCEGAAFDRGLRSLRIAGEGHRWPTIPPSAWLLAESSAADCPRSAVTRLDVG